MGMGRSLLITLATSAMGWPCCADDVQSSQQRLTLGANDSLAAGAAAIRGGQFDEGIRLTLLGLEDAGLSNRDRAAGLANLCAGYISKNVPDTALPFCAASLRLDAGNWRVYTARSQAYFLKGMFAEAARDNDAAYTINPDAAHVKMIRGKLNERRLQPHVIMEDRTEQRPNNPNNR